MLTVENNVKKQFSKNILNFENTEAEANRISEKLKEDILGVLKRKGAVIGISGGIFSYTGPGS